MKRSKAALALALAGMALQCGCSGVNEQILNTVPQVGRIRLSQPFAERQAYYEKVRVAGVNAGGSRVGGELYTDNAIRHHYKSYGATKAITYSRQATAARTKRIISGIVAPVAGMVVGFYVGYYAWLATSYSSYSSNSSYNNFWYVPAGAVAGAAIGGLAIALPINLRQKDVMIDRRQDAAEEFNRDLKRKLKLNTADDDEKDRKERPGTGGIDEQTIAP